MPPFAFEPTTPRAPYSVLTMESIARAEQLNLPALEPLVRSSQRWHAVRALLALVGARS